MVCVCFYYLFQWYFFITIFEDIPELEKTPNISSSRWTCRGESNIISESICPSISSWKNGQMSTYSNKVQIFIALIYMHIVYMMQLNYSVASYTVYNQRHALKRICVFYQTCWSPFAVPTAPTVNGRFSTTFWHFISKVLSGVKIRAFDKP